MHIILLYIITGLLLMAGDFLWLGIIGKKFYKKKLGFILSDKINKLPAAIFYFAYVFAILYFAVWPGLLKGQWIVSLLNGAFLGFISYATYNLTNMTTIRKWPLSVTIVDIGWGTFITATVSTGSFFIAGLM